MKWLKKTGVSLLLLSVMLMMFGQTAFAAEADTNYTYTVRVYAGDPKIGSLTGDGVTVETGSGAKVDYSDDCVTVSGLKFGDTVYIRAQDAAETVDSRYYVRGIIQAGREESEKTEGAFQVDGDRDYVAAYGIKGDMVAYTVNYLDASGNTLLASDTYYGNPGERQYVSSRYIDGYVPQALNLVKTLSVNEAENVFDFRYTPTAGETVTTPPAEGTDTAAGTDAAGTAGAGAAGTAAPGAAGTAAPGAAGSAGTPAPGDAGTPTDDEGLVEAPDEETPQNLVDLDDEEVPLANVKEDRPGTVMSHLPIYIGVGVAALAALAIMAIYLKKRRKKTS